MSQVPQLIPAVFIITSIRNYETIAQLMVNTIVAPKSLGTARRPGRPTKPGSKRSNPEYRPWSGLLRGQYIREADIVLKQTDDPRDMSDLITELLGTWVNERKGEGSIALTPRGPSQNTAHGRSV